jgi:hypothetical protein
VVAKIGRGVGRCRWSDSAWCGRCHGCVLLRRRFGEVSSWRKRSRFDCEFQERAEQKQRESSGRPHAASARVPVIVRSSTDDHGLGMDKSRQYGMATAQRPSGRDEYMSQTLLQICIGTVGYYRTVQVVQVAQVVEGPTRSFGRLFSGSTPPLDQGLATPRKQHRIPPSGSG